MNPNEKIRPLSLVFRNRIFALFFVLCASIYCCFGQQFQKYPFQSGKIQYIIEGSTHGIRTICWDDFGYKEVIFEESETLLFGNLEKCNKTILTIGNSIFEWKENENTVLQTNNPLFEIWVENGYTSDSINVFCDKVLQLLGYEYVGNEKVMGRDCAVFKGIDSVWVWKGFLLKSSLRLLETKTICTAVRFETNINLNNNIFTVPHEYSIKQTGIIFKDQISN